MPLRRARLGRRSPRREPSAPVATIAGVPLIRRHRRAAAEPATAPAVPEPDVVRLDPEQLHGLFAAPAWLRDVGVMSWLLVGFGALIFSLVWLVAQLQTIVIPVILGGVLGAVASPLVAWLERRGIPRLGGALLTLLLAVVVGLGVVLLVLGGLASESSTISGAMTRALDKIEGWLRDLGITKTEVKQELQKSVPDTGNALLDGVKSSLLHIASIATMLVFTAFSLLFILKDGPSMLRVGRAAHGATRTDRADRHRRHAARAAAVLPRRHDRRRLQRHSDRRRRADLGHPARGHDRARDVRRRVRARSSGPGSPASSPSRSRSRRATRPTR